MQAAMQPDPVDRIMQHLKELLPTQRPVALHEPMLQANAWEKVKDCLDSGWVSSVGSYVGAFEQGLADFTGIPHAIATVSGTAALHTCLLLAGVQPGDEVLLPALTFVGTANPVAAMGAMPHFVDAAEDSLGVDPVSLAAYLDEIAEQRDGQCRNRITGRRIGALIVVHVLGHVANMPALREITDRHGLKLIEDAAEALGSLRDGRHAGHWGDLAALSFNGNKIITTGGGGAVLTNNPELAQTAHHLTTTAKQPHTWAFDHDRVGYNYRMPNLNAALGVAQLEQLPRLLAAKRDLAQIYQKAFAGMPNAALFREPAGCRSNYWLNLLLLSDAAARDPLLQAAYTQGLHLRPFWTPLNRLPMYRACPSMPVPVCDELFARGVCLPSSAQLVSSGTER
jgi:perosamine synthetase